MAIPAGAPGFWQVLVELVADGSVSVAANGGQQVGPLRGGALDKLAIGAGDKEHAFYLPPSVYTRDAGVPVYILPVFDVPGVYPLGIYAGYARTYDSGTNQHQVSLYLRNLTAADHVCFYRVYRMKGLK